MTDRHDTTPAGSPHFTSLAELQTLTPARVGLGRVGASLTTQALLDFTLDHARARDAVHAPFESDALVAALTEQALPAIAVHSQAVERSDYLKRPDLGRKLSSESRQRLADLDHAGCDLVIVIADGLSAAAMNAHATDMLQALIPQLSVLAIGPVVVAGGARVALGDEIGDLLRARMTIMLIGERPGLSAPQSIGAYITFAPKPGLTDADRNCVSNIQAAGLTFDEAAIKIAWLAREGLGRGMTGVALKDESGLQVVKPLSAPL